MLRVISEAQQPWANALGAEIGEAKLRRAGGLLGEIECAVATKGMPGPAEGSKFFEADPNSNP